MLYSHPFIDQGEYLGRLQVSFSLAAIDAIRAELGKQVDAAEEASQKRSIVLVSVALLALVVVLLVSFYLVRSLVVPIKLIVGKLQSMATGDSDLTSRLPVSSKDEIGELSLNFNVLIEKLQGIIKDVIASAGSVDDSAGGITRVAGEMAVQVDGILDRSNQVAESVVSMNNNMDSVAEAMEGANANINMVASAAEEMSATVDEISQNSDQAHSITEKAVTQSGKSSGNQKTD